MGALGNRRSHYRGAATSANHGKGFAVDVADEVRKLAERSGRETKQIAELIAPVQTGTQEAVAAMDSGAATVEPT